MVREAEIRRSAREVRKAVEAAEELEDGEREMIGDGGFYITKIEGRFNDGRPKYSIHSPSGELLSYAWGRQKAVRAIREMYSNMKIEGRE